MKWYWWLLIGGALAVAAVLFVPWDKIFGSDNDDTLAKAREAKAEKARLERESAQNLLKDESGSGDTL